MTPCRFGSRSGDLLKLAAALDEYSLNLRRTRHGADRAVAEAALAALREYLLDYCGHDELAGVTAEDLFAFLLDYSPAEEEPHPEQAAALLEAAAGFAAWVIDRGDRALAPFAAARGRLEEDLPRAAAAYLALRDHARRDDLSTPVEAAPEEQPEAVATADSGLHRLARLDQIRYEEADNDRFTLVRVAPEGLTLTSPGRAVLGLGDAMPVRVPAEAAALLRSGDTLHAEIAPGPDGWELLDVFSVRPGGCE